MKYLLGLNSEIDLDNNIIKKFEGVGMIRGENLCINKMQYFTIDSFCDYVTDYLNIISTKFNPKPVWYRTADLVSHQINILDGCDKEMQDEQYLIGLRGIRRNLLFLDTYYKELMAFIKASKNNENLGIVIPFISNENEINKVKNILNNLDYKGKIGIMVEIPSVVINLDSINEIGVDYYCIGINDLTTMILGSKRNIDDYNINDAAVYKTIKYITDKIHSFNKPVTLAGYLNKEIIEYSDKIGVDYINIHYHEIPNFLSVTNNDSFEKHYSEIKEKYNKKKKEYRMNERF